MTARPTGTLTKKIERHWLPRTSADTSTPPRTWPATAPIDSAIAYSPIARARCAPSKVSWMAVSVWGNMSAAPAPCNPRAAIRAIGPGARPQSSEALVKAPTPSRNTRRYPWICPSRAPVMSSTAKAIR